jgi:hypothetical protein
MPEAVDTFPEYASSHVTSLDGVRTSGVWSPDGLHCTPLAAALQCIFGRFWCNSMRRWRLMNCSPALQCISICRFEREVLGFPRFQVSRGQYGDCKNPTAKPPLMHSKVCNLACLRTIYSNRAFRSIRRESQQQLSLRLPCSSWTMDGVRVDANSTKCFSSTFLLKSISRALRIVTPRRTKVCDGGQKCFSPECWQ